MSNTDARLKSPIARWAQLLALVLLSMGAWSIATPAGAQEECGTYGPACPTGSDSGGDAGTAGPAGDTRNCTEIKEQTGRTDIPKGDPLYRLDLDDNRDGIACEDGKPGGTGGATGTSGTSGTGGTTASSTGSTGAVTPANVGGVAQQPVSGQLGRTGTSAGTIALVAAAVVLLGSALVLGARRRNNQPTK